MCAIGRVYRSCTTCECGCIPAHAFTVFSSGFDIDQVQWPVLKMSGEIAWRHFSALSVWLWQLTKYEFGVHAYTTLAELWKASVHLLYLRRRKTPPSPFLSSSTESVTGATPSLPSRLNEAQRSHTVRKSS